MQVSMSSKSASNGRFVSRKSAKSFHPSKATRPANFSSFITKAAVDSSTQSATSQKTSQVPVEYVDDKEFSISKISFGSILVPAGSALLAYGFGAYFALLPGGDVSSILLVYGFPMALLGAALSYAQLEPAPCKTTKAAFLLRDAQCTDIQKQIREDCTRFRYGDEQHLEEALDKIFRFNKANGIPRKFSPVLVGLREVEENGAYTLVLEFKSSLEFSKWEERQSKFQSFFGPGIVARIEKSDQGADVYLVCDGSGEGRGGKQQKDVLLPLMPGLKARRQD
ncbi:hypothetical protein CEUSTIGMA_g4068.t1 [Chlamydomonas eustigma]|uniref:Thylakoid membrane protein n=1 Tax=Chlamydomonas eustigma TaxID=1157962 RepID=A0A250X159_9CHLO|nr:hypothetical protein CEUSTIGMA_g4068.t1 [Chlamydomonas eustigma]|eukprot:GAX76622.1 hypothetical protein CEUSTIGMA_g4068.t1 [Chlamydomonas eustigma]